MIIQNKDKYFSQEILIQIQNLSDHKILIDTIIMLFKFKIKSIQFIQIIKYKMIN